jgi:ribose 5-phosphate isomerase B
MKIAVASNHVGYQVKAGIVSQLRGLGHEALDFGPSNDDMCDYPDYAAKAARAVSIGDADRAILVGGTGIGMSIVANKFPGVRAALCHCELSTRMSRSVIDANILCLSANLFDENAATRMIEIWLETPFEGGRHARRIAKITRYERRSRKTTDDCAAMLNTHQSDNGILSTDPANLI